MLASDADFLLVRHAIVSPFIEYVEERLRDELRRKAMFFATVAEECCEQVAHCTKALRKSNRPP